MDQCRRICRLMTTLEFARYCILSKISFLANHPSLQLLNTLPSRNLQGSVTVDDFEVEPFFLFPPRNLNFKGSTRRNSAWIWFDDIHRSNGDVLSTPCLPPGPRQIVCESFRSDISCLHYGSHAAALAIPYASCRPSRSPHRSSNSLHLPTLWPLSHPHKPSHKMP